MSLIVKRNRPFAFTLFTLHSEGIRVRVPPQISIKPFLLSQSALSQKSLGQHFSLGHVVASWLAAWASSCALLVLTISRRQFWHCSRLAGQLCAMMPYNARASGEKRKSAYDGRRLRRLDGKAVCLYWRAGASLVGLLVLALDLV